MANRIVTATVTGESIKLSEKTAGAAGSFNAVSLSFTFDSAWDGTTKKVYFFDAYGNNAVYILLTTDLLVDGKYIVPIPAEPLVYAGEMTITVKGIDFATDGTTAERIIMSASTTMKVLSAISPASDVVPTEPTPTQAEQLQAEIDALIASIVSIPTNVTAAANSASAAATSETNAATSASTASTKAGEASASASSAATSASTATTKATEASTSATNAANSATAAAGSATTAVNAKTAAETAQGLAETAKTAAELAETHAETAETNAGTHATNAGLSATAASGSATAANSAKLAAQTAQTAAELAETNAETAETNAETAETNATAKAVLAESYAKGGTGTRSGEDTDNAKYYKEQAAAIVGGDLATKTEAQGYVNTHDASGTAHSALFAAKQDTTNSLTAETALADGDYIPFYDTSATANRKSLWSNIKSVLKTYFDTVYATLTHVHGNITNAGAIGSTASLPVVTTTSGVLTTSTAQAMGGLLGDGYGTCSTAGATAAKVVTCSGFALVTGGYAAVKFTNTDTSTSPTLNINSKGAKSIYYNGATITAGMINSAKTAFFVYNGTQYELLNPMPATIVPVATTSVAGLESAEDKTKLDGIATGAEVNVNADWNASSGDAQILNKPTQFTPTSHTHGDITNDGKIGSTADLPVFTTTSGAVTTKTIAQAQTLLGVPTSYAKIVIGSYTGTGTDSAVVISYATKPAMIILQRRNYSVFGSSSTANQFSNWFLAFNATTSLNVGGGYANSNLTFTWGTTSLSIEVYSNNYAQINNSGVVYDYALIYTA